MVPNAAALRLGLGMPRIISHPWEKVGGGKFLFGVDTQFSLLIYLFYTPGNFYDDGEAGEESPYLCAVAY